MIWSPDIAHKLQVFSQSLDFNSPQSATTLKPIIYDCDFDLNQTSTCQYLNSTKSSFRFYPQTAQTTNHSL